MTTSAQIQKHTPMKPDGSPPPGYVKQDIALSKRDFEKWLDSHTDVEKLDLAKLNPDAEWAKPWLEKAAVIDADVAKRETEAKESVEKALGGFMKSTFNQVSKTHGDFNTKLAAFKAANPKLSINDFVETDEGQAAKQAYEDARASQFAGPVTPYTKSLVSELEKLDSEIAKSVESYAITHDLEPADARKRLERVSPSFAGLVKRHAEASHERAAAINKARVDAQHWLNAEAARATAAERDEVAKASEQRRLKSTTPSERKFDDRVGEIMKMRSLARPAATVWAIANDDVAKSLYEVTREERATGSRS